MENSDWALIEQSFYQLLEKSDSERDAYLEEIRKSDPGLYQELVSLVESMGEASTFLSEPIAARKPGLVAEALSVIVKDDDESSVSLSGPWFLVDQAIENPTVPKQLGNLSLDCILGEGGMGQVFLATQEEGPIKRQVALKLIRGTGFSEKALRMFEAEQQALALLSHHHIAHVYEVGKTLHGIPFFTMEYVEGLTITHYCDRHRLGIEARIRLFLQICNGIAHAHLKGVLHRDIKPSNILITESEGRPLVKIIDFGIARALFPLAGAERIDYPPGLIGTPRYMSPEYVLHGQSDTRGDIYSLGALFYELISGLPALELKKGKLTKQELGRLLESVMPEPMGMRLASFEGLSEIARFRGLESKKMLRKFSKPLDAVVFKALEKNPERRYQTVQALRDDLSAFLENRPVSVMPWTPYYLLKTYLGRHQKLAWLTGGALIVVFVLLTVLAINYQDKQRALREVQEVGLQLEKRGEQVNASLGYLDIILSAPNPYEDGADVPFLDVLGRGEAALLLLSPSEYEVEIRIRQTLALTYLDLSLYDKAEIHLTIAITLLRQNFGLSHRQTLKARYHLGRCFFLMGKAEQALAEITQVFDAQRNTLGVNHAEVFDTELVRAGILRVMGERDQAMEIGKSVLERTTAVGSSKVWAANTIIGNIYIDTRQWENALDHYHDALKYLEGIIENFQEHPDVLIIRNNMAICHMNLDNFKEAEPLFRQVLEARLELLGPDHEFTLKSRHEVVHVMHQLGNHGNAELAYREVLRDQTDILGSDHAITLVTRGNLAALLVQCESHEEAIERLIPLYRLYQVDDEVSHHEMRASNNLASALNDTGQFFRALPIAETALDQKLEILGEKDNSTHVTMFNLGEALLGLRQYDEAEVIFRDTVRLAEKHQSRRWHYLALYRGFHGYTLMRLGREAEGRPLFEKNKKMLASVPSFLEMLEELEPDAVPF